MRWARNALAHVPAKHRAAVSAMLKTIFAQESKAAATLQWGEVADALRARHAKLGEMMDASREDVLATMAFPAQHRTKLHSTNPLERLNREIKRRSDVVGIDPPTPPPSDWSDVSVMCGCPRGCKWLPNNWSA